MTAWWVTVEHSRGCTRDHRITARGPWAAWWLGCQLWGAPNVLLVRQVR